MNRLLAAIAALTLLILTPAQADDKIGVVLLHGKQGMPLGSSAPGSNRAPLGGELIAAIKDAGYLVAAPEMCWSRKRGLDRPFADCLKEVDDAVAGLKAKGATAIVVGGLSQGGNAALAYGTAHADILGVIAYAPADDPASKSRVPAVASAILKAQRMAADGRGGEKASFDDVNTGPQGAFTTEIDTTADVYLSFYGPDSQTSIPGNAAKLKVPVLWVSGDKDPSQRDAKSAFDRAPANPLNRFVRVSSNHVETPNAGRDATLAWLKELAASR